ncbi:hypothetical protein [Planomicrobium sp. CPCC 101079]|uniref:hypothetical protein n=1 Tax=Planomicrobium sp. CPCC 101079 TaxID=2599618 RepID=UPI0011B49E15|nr:hypothetical protein [Planomicrobium sp. CPCC 101079]TWT00634.1 hypothetical protein FQV28_18170 [Planomicrobium sp. CPCC 101079]
MYVQVGKTQTIQINEIIAVIHHENYMPAAFVRLLVPREEVRAFIVTADFVYGSPYRAQAIVKKINDRRL